MGYFQNQKQGEKTVTCNSKTVPSTFTNKKNEKKQFLETHRKNKEKQFLESQNLFQVLPQTKRIRKTVA